jgi:hypothetical protein
MRTAVRFKVGDRVRYRPRECVYGYETSIEADGCVPGIVIGFTKQRVRVRLTMTLAGVKSQRDRAVEAESLERAS